jgi:hypothetical protein
MNPFTILVAITNFMAAGWHCWQGEYRMMTVWLCYGIAGAALAFAK